MVLAVPPNTVDQLISLFQGEGVEATVIGEFTDTRRLELFYEGNLVGDLDMEFLHKGLPQLEKRLSGSCHSMQSRTFRSQLTCVKTCCVFCLVECLQ